MEIFEQEEVKLPGTSDQEALYTQAEFFKLLGTLNCYLNKSGYPAQPISSNRDLLVGGTAELIPILRLKKELVAKLQHKNQLINRLKNTLLREKLLMQKQLYVFHVL